MKGRPLMIRQFWVAPDVWMTHFTITLPCTLASSASRVYAGIWPATKVGRVIPSPNATTAPAGATGGDAAAAGGAETTPETGAAVALGDGSATGGDDGATVGIALAAGAAGSLEAARSAEPSDASRTSKASSVSSTATGAAR